ncbi:MAG TPA: ABC transporter permease [Defluviitoga sp.]|nr:ABC transporter permease [Defluviitoga sp.]HPZ29539.1 ABC transporter permease [Defluviitoga sp.]
MDKGALKFRSFFIKYGTLLSVLILLIIFSLFVPNFSNPQNLINILRQMALLTIISEGFTMCLIVGELDLSFANVASLSSVVVATMLVNKANPLSAVLLTLLIGFVFGLANGLLITKVGISAMIVTLATGIIAQGLAFMYTKGVSVYGSMPKGFLTLGRGSVGPIPSLVIIMALVVVFFHVLTNRTKVGRYMEATGQNPTAAYLAGISVNLYKILGMIFSSLGAAFVGILLTSRLGSATPTGGAGFLMDGFATSLLGMTVLGLGRASPFGTFIGALLIGLLNNGMTLLGAPYYIQDITKGSIIILAVAITSSQSRKLGK